mgnify:FL=1
MKRSNAEIKLHNLRGELRFLVTLDSTFKGRADFLIQEIENCPAGKEVEMHKTIQNVISKKHEEIKTR